MGLVSEIMNEVFKEENEANCKGPGTILRAKVIHIHPEWLRKLWMDPEFKMQAYGPVEQYRLHGIPLNPTQNIEKWKIII